MRDNPIRKEKMENLKKASSLPFKKRLVFYWDFFKFYLLALIVIGVIAFIFIKQIFFAPEIILNGYIVNRSGKPSCSDEEFISSFPLYSDIDNKKQKIYFSSDMLLSDTDYESSTKLIAQTATGEIDFMICNENTFNTLSQMSLLENIDGNEDLKSRYESRFVSYDHTKNDTDEDDFLGVKTYGIDVSDSAVLSSFNAFKDDDKVYLCIGTNSETDDTVLSFINWICPVK